MKDNLHEFVEEELNLLMEQEYEYMKGLSIDQLDHRLIQGKTPQEFINDNIRALIEPLYSIQDYSNSNIDYLLQATYALAHFQNLVPLTLLDNEFEEVCKDWNKALYQNKRNHSVFKEVTYKHLDGEEALMRVCDKIKQKSEEKYEQLQFDFDI